MAPTSTAKTQKQSTTENNVQPLDKDQALKLFEQARSYTEQGLRKSWDTYYKIYIGQRVNPQYKGNSAPVIREPHTILETLVANIAGGNPKFMYRPTIEEQSKDVTVLNSYVDYILVRNRLPLKVQEWVREMLLYGTGIVMVGYENGCPTITNIPLRDFFVDPTSTGFVNTQNPAKYCGYIYFADKEDLKKATVYDPDKDKWVKKYSNLSKLGPSPKPANGNETGSLDKQFKDMFHNSTLGDEAPNHQIEVVCLYDLRTGMQYEIGNRKEIIYQAPLWTQREEESRDIEDTDLDGNPVNVTQTLDAIAPFLPFVALRDYIDSSQFYGRGEIEVIAQDAELLNDYEAMIFDNNALQNTPIGWVDPSYADMTPEIQAIPGLVLPIPRNAMGWFEIPQIANDLDEKEQRVMERMRRATAADEAVQGVSQSKSRTTATEVQSQLSQAQQRFATKIQNLESEGFAQLASIIFKVIQIFVTQEQVVRVVGPKGVEFKNFDPYEFNGEYEAYAELETTVKQKKMETGQRDNQIFELLTNDPQQVFDPVELKRFMVQTINPDMTDEKFNKLLAPPKPKPERDPREFLTLSYKDATPFTKAQIEKKLELQPDPMHEVEAKQLLVGYAADNVNRLDQTVDKDGKPLAGMPGSPEALQPVTEQPEEAVA